MSTLIIVTEILSIANFARQSHISLFTAPISITANSENLKSLKIFAIADCNNAQLILKPQSANLSGLKIMTFKDWKSCGSHRGAGSDFKISRSNNSETTNVIEQSWYWVDIFISQGRINKVYKTSVIDIHKSDPR